MAKEKARFALWPRGLPGRHSDVAIEVSPMQAGNARIDGDGVDGEEVQIYSSTLLFSEDLVAEQKKPPAKPEPEIILTGLWGWLARSLGIQPWGQVLILVLLGVFSSISLVLWQGFAKLSRIEAHIAVIETRLGLQVGADLIGSVKSYVEKGDTHKAIEAAESAKTLILAAKEKKVPAPPGYFVNTITLLNNVEPVRDSKVAAELFSARIALAEYHSVLQAPPDIPEKLVTLQLLPGTPITPAMLGGKAVYRITAQLSLPPKVNLLSEGAVFNGSEIPEGTDILNPFGRSFATNNNWVDGLIFYGVTQTLDGIEWKGVVFVNAHIRYLGGDLRLENVRFVNCTFDVPPSNRGAQFADYAALETKIFRTG